MDARGPLDDFITLGGLRLRAVDLRFFGRLIAWWLSFVLCFCGGVQSAHRFEPRLIDTASDSVFGFVENGATQRSSAYSSVR